MPVEMPDKSTAVEALRTQTPDAKPMGKFYLPVASA